MSIYCGFPGKSDRGRGDAECEVIELNIVVERFKGAAG